MGTNDGGRTVLNDCPILDSRTAMAAKTLGLRAHIVGGRQALVAYRYKPGLHWYTTSHSLMSHIVSIYLALGSVSCVLPERRKRV